MASSLHLQNRSRLESNVLAVITSFSITLIIQDWESPDKSNKDVCATNCIGSSYLPSNKIMGAFVSTAAQPAAENESEEMKKFLNVLPSQHLEPLWSQMNTMVPPTPNPTAVAHMWKYEEALPHLQNAGRLVPEEKAERRVLMLVNPSMRKSAPWVQV
jgi:hypothetical protein